MKICKNTKNHT